MAKVIKKVKKHLSEVKREILKNMLLLASSGFGLIAALAWNELIKEIVDGYIKPLVGSSSKVISLFIYAVLVTVLAVVVTYNLTSIIKKNG